MVLSKISALHGIMEKIGVGMAMSRNWDDPPMQILLALAGGAGTLIIGEYYIAMHLGPAYMALPLLMCYIFYHYVMMVTPPADTKKVPRIQGGQTCS